LGECGGGSVIVSSTENKYFANSTMTANQGLLEWRGGGQFLACSTSGTPVNFDNTGIFRLTADGTPGGRLGSSLTPVFNNLTGDGSRRLPVPARSTGTTER
jgi:hypothetical protein